jgi:hypothetical protein
MSNRRKLKQANGGALTRPRDQWSEGTLRTGQIQSAGSSSAIWRRARRTGFFGQKAPGQRPRAMSPDYR